MQANIFSVAGQAAQFRISFRKFTQKSVANVRFGAIPAKQKWYGTIDRP